MVALVREKAQTSGGTRIRAIVSRAEDLAAAPLASLELVALGNAFHRLARDVVAANAVRWLQPKGYLALLWANGPWRGDSEWQSGLGGLLTSWRHKLEVEDRVPAGWEDQQRARPDAVVLKAAGFQDIRRARFPTIHEWTVDALIGVVYSTSFLPRAGLGRRAQEFERDVDRQLAAFTAKGPLRETIDFAYELAQRPGN